MKSWWTVAAPLAALAALASAAAVAAPNLITQPDWIARPNGEDFSEAYPTLALAFEIGGKAIIRCEVDTLGKLQACEVLGETPAGLGFGDAALSMTAAFQIRPQSVNGLFVEGGDVRIPLRFVPQRQEEPPPPPSSPSSPRALELARTLVAFNSSGDETRIQIEDTARKLEAAALIIPAYGQIGAALRESYPRRAAQAREHSAAVLADAFTEDELAQLVGYFSSPAASMMLKAAEQNGELSKRFGKALSQIAVARARGHFCASAHCVEAGKEPFPAGANLPGTITEPVWSQRPSREVVTQFSPPAAKALRVAAAARVSCVVGSLGAMDDCTVTEEAPKGLGVAKSAKSLARYYRLDPAQLAEATTSKRVTLDVLFPAEVEDPVQPLPEIAARSPHAMSLARELASMQDTGGGLQSAMNGLIDEQRKIAGNSGLTPAEFDTLADAMARGVMGAFEQSREASAAQLTALLSDEQLVAATQFWRGPIGKAWKTKSPGVLAQSAVAGAIYGRLVLADAGRAFCKISDCEGTALQPNAEPTPAQPTSANPEPSSRKP